MLNRMVKKYNEFIDLNPSPDLEPSGLVANGTFTETECTVNGFL